MVFTVLQSFTVLYVLNRMQGMSNSYGEPAM
jgi:hypothetical protein